MDKKAKAKKMYEDGFKYKEIVSELSLSMNTLKSWKKREGWLRKGAPEKQKKVRAGAPKGNKNAVGGKGNKNASPPKGNKNAVVTGEYETIFASTLSEEEMAIYSDMDDDPLFLLTEEVRMLKIRQLRMMNRIKKAESGLDEFEIETLQQLRKVKEPVEVDGKIITQKKECLVDVQITKYAKRKIDDVLAIEAALTRISNQLTKTTKQIIEYSDSHNEKTVDVPIFVDDIGG